MRRGVRQCAGLALCAVGLCLFASLARAQPGLDLLTISGADEQSQTWSVSLQILLFMTVLSVLPALLMTMTSFTRVVIILAILRQGLGTQQTPSNTILVGMALILTGFIMAPVMVEVQQQAVEPYMAETMSGPDALAAATGPLREFMLSHTRHNDLELFFGLRGEDPVASVDEVPLTVLLPAFLTSELRTAFEIGFMLLLPFLVIDLVVASVLMSVGMVMLSPLIISLPFKIMLFVVVDGWSLVMTTVARSFSF